MRRNQFIIAILIVIGILCLSYNVLGYPGKSIEEVSDVSFDDISRIVFYDGRGGRYAPLTLDDKQKIEEFLRLIEQCRIKRLEVVEPSVGWIHHAIFYSGNERVFDITFVDPMIINGKYYKVLRGKLSTARIDDYLRVLR